MKDNVTDIAFTQGRLMQVILTQIQMLNAGLTVPHFLKEQEKELDDTLKAWGKINREIEERKAA